MKKYIVIIAILLVSSAMAQNKIDSLKQTLKTEIHDTVRLDTYLKIGEVYARSLSDSAFAYYQKAYNYSKLKKNDRYLAASYLHFGVYYAMQGEQDKALDYYKKSLDINKRIGLKNGIGPCLLNIANIYSSQCAYDKAINSYQKSLLIYEELKDSLRIGIVYRNIGNVYYNQESLDKAIEYYQKSLSISTKFNDINNVAGVLNGLGSVFFYQKEYELALQNYQEAISYYEQLGRKPEIAVILGNVAMIYAEQKKYDKAMKYYQESLELNIELGFKHGQITTYSNTASLYNKMKKYDKSVEFAMKSLRLSKEINLIDWQKYSLDLLSVAYKGLGDYKKALMYNERAVELNDSIFNIEKTKAINEIQTKYETKKKELEIEKNVHKIESLEQKAEKNRIIFIAIALILLLVIIMIVLVYRYRLTKSKYQADMFNQKLLRLQMNPHFIFNTLASIQSYMFEKDTKKAALYLSSFAKLTRSILDSSRQDFISMQEDYENNDNYLRIQKMRYENRFDYSITVDESIDPENVLIAPMLIQPFVENAVVHGFKNIKSDGHIKIAYKKVGDTVEISIEDNGEGIDEKKNAEHKSHALDITKERLSILNKKTKNHITFKIVSAGEKGFKVIFTVPYKIN